MEEQAAVEAKLVVVYDLYSDDALPAATIVASGLTLAQLQNQLNALDPTVTYYQVYEKVMQGETPLSFQVVATGQQEWVWK